MRLNFEMLVKTKVIKFISTLHWVFWKLAFQLFDAERVIRPLKN